MSVWIIWIVAGVFLMLAEMFTSSFFVFLIGLSCILAGLTAVFTDSVPVQLSVFIISTLLLLIFIRPFCMKYFSKTTKISNINALIGKEFVVTTAINNHDDKGYIKSGGDYWRARTVDDSTVEEGKTVIAERIEGATIFVKPKA